jgi:hypothetical protein
MVLDDPVSHFELSSEPRRKSAADWLWRPWYAKLYWAGVMGYWGAFLASWIWALSPSFFKGTSAGYLGLAFHPATALVLLGAGYVKALFYSGEWEWAKQSRDDMRNRRSLTGMSSPYSDPADPRSGVNWIGSYQTRLKRHSRSSH